KSVDNNATTQALREHFAPSESLAIDSMLPFSSERKYSKTMFTQLGSLYLGAPDILLSATGQEPPKELAALEKSGDRLLLVGLDVSGNEHPTHFSSLALVVLQDPLREDAEKIISFFKEEDIAIKIISGDHPATVATIAHQAGVDHALDYVDATTLTDYEHIVDAVERYTVFGRVQPKQKQQIIQAMKQKGHNVAMSGDGVNDVLALKESDCSIAIANGAQAASQVSQLVLLDSDFSNVPLVLREGRRVVNNIQRSASLFLVKTMFSFLLTALAILLGFPYPFMPIQLSLISNFIEGFPAFFLQLEPNNERVSGSFLKTVFDNGFPTALLIVAYVLLTQYILAPALQLDAIQSNTLSFYLMGMAWLMQLFHVCRPFTYLRVALWIASFIGFFASAFLLGSWIGLGALTRDAWIVFLALALATYPMQLVLSALNHKVQALLAKHLPHKKSK
ncbi:MAG: HAD-IC family P-type ATPase, partial [Erysipelotrichaceae bacterium]